MGISMGSKGTISRENMGKAGKIHDNQFFEWICQWEKQQSVAGIRTQPACIEVPNFLEGLGTTVKQGRSRVRKIFTWTAFLCSFWSCLHVDPSAWAVWKDEDDELSNLSIYGDGWTPMNRYIFGRNIQKSNLFWFTSVPGLDCPAGSKIWEKLQFFDPSETKNLGAPWTYRLPENSTWYLSLETSETGENMTNQCQQGQYNSAEMRRFAASENLGPLCVPLAKGSEQIISRRYHLNYPP